MNIAKNLQEKRSKAGITQKQAADAIGVQQSTISMWESGNSVPTVTTLIKAAEVYGCTAAELLE